MSIRFIVFIHNCMRLELPNLFVNVSSPFYISLSVIVWLQLDNVVIIQE